MKKILNFLEGEKQRILEQHRSAIISNYNKNIFINEEIIQGKEGDPYEYKREDNLFFTRKKGSQNWIKLTDGTKAFNAVKKLFSQNTNLRKDITTGKNSELTNKKTETLDDYLKRTQGVFYSTDPEAAKEYNKYSTAEDDYYTSKARTKRAIELTPNILIPQIFKGSGGERLNKEVYYINNRSEYQGIPFFIHDPKMKLIAAFDAQHNLVAYTPTLIGQDEIKTETITLKKWCEESGYKYVPNAPTDSKKCVDNKNVPVKLDLDKLEEIEGRYLTPGIYVGGKPMKYSKGVGNPNIESMFAIRDRKTKETLPAAIHALFKSPIRIQTDDMMKSYLKSSEFGLIPDKYKQLTDRLLKTKEANLSYGCINVAPEFIQNPKVLEIAKSSPYIFVMSDEDNYYLVQMDTEKGTEYFNEIQGDGTRCKSPMSIADNLGVKIA